MNMEKANMRVSKWTHSLDINGQPIRRPGTRSITIHWIGPYCNQRPESPLNWWNTDDNYHSATFIVKDGRVLQCCDIDLICRHAGHVTGNNESIGIEVIPADNVGRFSDETCETLKKLIEHIRGLKPEWNKLPLMRHYDWTGKDCPRFYTPVTSLVGLGGRLANPEGGDARWETLKKYLNGEVL